MSTLTVTAKGQVTLRKDLLEHLGVHPGEKIAVEKLPDGRIEVKAARPTGKTFKSWSTLFRESRLEHQSRTDWGNCEKTTFLGVAPPYQ